MIIIYSTPPAKIEAGLRDLKRNGGSWTKVLYGSNLTKGRTSETEVPTEDKKN